MSDVFSSYFERGMPLRLHWTASRAIQGGTPQVRGTGRLLRRKRRSSPKYGDKIAMTLG